LTPANLAVVPDPTNVDGFTEKASIQPDPQFAAYASTSPLDDSAANIVLLPGAPSQGDMRYVLGPVGFSASGIKSARVAELNGQWMVSLVLTASGSVRWDALVHQQFHAMVGIVDHGTVISAPITQPTQSSFRSFDGRVQISGDFTKQEATALAAQL
jgi:preprotein translocase subunit SecD